MRDIFLKSPPGGFKSILLTYNDRNRVREHQQAVPPGAREHRNTQPRGDYPQARRDRGLQRIRTLPGHSRKTLQQLSRSSQNQYRHRKILK